MKKKYEIWKNISGIISLLLLIGFPFLSIDADEIPPRVLHHMLGYKFELEDLKAINGKKALPIKIQHPNPSNYMYLRLELEYIDDFTELVIPDIPAGAYDVLVGYLGRADFGVMKMHINGDQLGPEIDTYAGHRQGALKAAYMGQITFQESGSKRLRFAVIGKNEGSEGYGIGIDYIEFRKHPSSYLEMVKGFAETLLSDANDVYGDKRTGMLLSIMNRKPSEVYELRLPPEPGGIRAGDRDSMHGSNMNMMQNIYRSFYALSELTGNDKYASAADRALKDFIDLAQSPITGLLAWGEHISFDLMSDSGGHIVNRPTGGKYYQLFVENGTLAWAIDDAVKKTQVNFPIKAGQWYHVVAIRENGKEIRLYVNGKHALSAKDETDTDITSDTALYIGDKSTGQRAFKGWIDEVGIYNRVLTRNEVLQSYSAYMDASRTQIAEEGLVSYWTFHESDIEGKNVKDIRGSNDGTISGDPRIVAGNTGDALEFDGDDRIVFGNDPSVLLSGTDFSIVASFKADTVGVGLPDSTSYLVGTYSEDADTVIYHEMKRKMVFWDYYYKVNPQAALRFARGLWEHQIHNRETGDFSRHAGYNQHRTGSGYDFPKEAGYTIEVWAQAYRDSQEEVFLEAIDMLSQRYINKLNHIYQIEHDTRRPEQSSPIENLSLAICSANAAKWLPEGDLRSRLKKLAKSIDKGFHLLEHDIKGPGFIYICHTETGKPYPRESHQAVGYAVDWELKYGRKTNAQVALLCYTRMLQLPEGGTRYKYRDAILTTADKYLHSDPDVNNVDIWPGEYGMAVFLQIVAYRLTGEAKYLSRARHFANEAILHYFDPDSLLPKATNWVRHYECVTRCDTLILSLLALHVAENDLLVEIPISDIDR